MGVVTATVFASAATAAAQTRAAYQEKSFLGRLFEEDKRLREAFEKGGEEAFKQEHIKIQLEREDRKRRAALAASRNSADPNRFDFHWHAAMCRAEVMRRLGLNPEIDIAWSPVLEDKQS